MRSLKGPRQSESFGWKVLMFVPRLLYRVVYGAVLGQAETYMANIKTMEQVSDTTHRFLGTEETETTQRAVLGDQAGQAVCEACGTTSYFAVTTSDTIQECRYCGAYVDVEFDSPGSSDGAAVDTPTSS